MDGFGLSVSGLEPGCVPDGFNGGCSCDHPLSSDIGYLQGRTFTEAHSLFHFVELGSQARSMFPNPSCLAAKGAQACALGCHEADRDCNS